jgi:protein-L-isoaspartate(D-aspartate) O-methyltransferase
MRPSVGDEDRKYMSGRYAPALRRADIDVSRAERRALADLSAEMAAKGFCDPFLLDAIEKTPRAPFLPEGWHDHAFRDRPVPIDCGQTMEAPSDFALLAAAAGIGPGQRVLEIGTGSGWGSAVLAALAAKVYTVERFQRLGEAALERFGALGCDNVVASVHDGLDGWSRHAPFDRIVVAGGLGEPPAGLIGQLGTGGLLVATIGTGRAQVLTRFERTERGVVATPLRARRAVPMIAGRALVL